MTGPAPSQPARRTEQEHILVRGVNWLGDAIMSTPALLRLRQARPQARIALFTPEKLADLWLDHPAVDDCLPFSGQESLWGIVRRLRDRRFDIALVLPNSTRSALEPFLARIPERIGYGGRGRKLLLTRVIPQRSTARPMKKRSPGEIRRLVNASPPHPRAPIPETAHHIHQYLTLAAALGAMPSPQAPFIQVGETEVDRILRKFELAPDLPDQPLLGLNPGAEYGPAKRWPAERFAETVLKLQDRISKPCRWILFGGKADAPLCETIASKIRHSGGASGAVHPPRLINLAGATTLRELCALLKACRVVLTNDTGPMHVAAAVGTPVVAIFGSTSPELTGPGLGAGGRVRILRADVPCSPCFLRECPIDHRCMLGFPADQVAGQVAEAAGLDAL